MIIDITGTVLTPGNGGKDCLGNGMQKDIPCCCDECDYMQCCLLDRKQEDCFRCGDKDCPRPIIKTASMPC